MKTCKLSEWKHDIVFMIVYWDQRYEDYTVISVPNDEEYVLNHFKIKAKTQILKNLFKVDYKGNVTKFQDLELGEKLQLKIKELTGK